jgi:DNA-binding NtrC family response regulator
MRRAPNGLARHGDLDSLQGVQVLIVEDAWHVAKALKFALEEVGMNVAGPVATTAEARELIGARTPAVAVVDVNLRSEMACGLIDDLYNLRVPVVVVSGYATPPVSAGKAVAILQKPFNSYELLKALSDAVARKQAK